VYSAGSDSPENHGKGHAYQRSQEQPENVLGLGHAIVTSSEPHDELGSRDGYPQGADDHADDGSEIGKTYAVATKVVGFGVQGTSSCVQDSRPLRFE